jgi:2-dehydropantoate 2-reductase
LKIAILGPGGVGGLLAAVLSRSGEEVIVIARESTAAKIAEQGVQLASVTFGDFVAHPRASDRLSEPVDALIVATKAEGMLPALERIQDEPGIVLPQLNGLDHIPLLRSQFEPAKVLAGSIRVEADRPQAGVVIHTSPFLLVSMATSHPQSEPPMKALGEALTKAEIPIRYDSSEAQVMWSKLVRLNALACTTSAYDKLLGEIRSTPSLRAELIGAIDEASAVALAEGADETDPLRALDELERAHETLGSSMQRDIAAHRMPELDAIPGSVLRAAARHDLRCPTIERLVAMIAQRAGVPLPSV